MTMTTIINQFGDLVKQKGFNPELNNKKLPRANKIISAFPFVKPTNPTPPKTTNSTHRKSEKKKTHCHHWGTPGGKRQKQKYY